MLGAEHVAVQVCDPLPARRRHVQVRDRLVQVGRDAAPVEVGIALDQVGRGGVAELAVKADLLELIEQRIGLLQVERVAELPDQVRGLDQPSPPGPPAGSRRAGPSESG